MRTAPPPPHGAEALRCVSTAFVAKTLPLPCVSAAFVAKAMPLPCVCAAFVAKTVPLPCVFHCPRIPLSYSALVQREHVFRSL